ncbi:MAG: SPOR domain-containing protein [Sulfurimonadaceae bacterium]|jgi:DedD protein|nr:SPOR domain-containing protein [Sulfurimonadaceae bacterium]
MEEKNELNDIILNKGGVSSNNKKIILAVATLGIVLIIVIMIMNTLSSTDSENLPQAILPPEPKIAQVEEDPLFEEVEVVQENGQNSDNLDLVAQKLIAESQQQIEEVIQGPVVEPKKVVSAPKVATTPKQVQQTQPAQAKTGSYYIQVGSFSTYEPNKKFLKSITDKGYSYTYHKVSSGGKTLNKVLVGPFKSEKEARDALRTVRSSIESGAFLTKI